MARLLGTFFLLAALATLAYDTWEYIGTRNTSLVSSYELWSMLGSDSLVTFRAFVENNLPLGLWNGFIAPILSLPAVLLLGLIAVLLMIRGRRRGPV